MVREPHDSLRPSRSEMEWLVIALLISLALHLAVWGIYETGQKFGWWKKVNFARQHNLAKKISQPPAQNSEPTIFVEVTHAEPEPPKTAKYYSDKNSSAANRETENSNQPKLNGKQKNVPKLENVPQTSKLQPSPPTEESQPQPENSPMNVGDLKLDKTNNIVVAQKSSATRPRPRTIKQALAQRNNQMPGEEMEQDGGVRRHLEWSSLDTKATPFGAYDRAIIEAVQQRWYDLLDSRQFAGDRKGKVVVQFKLKFDGTISETSTSENSVGELLGYVCVAAIQESAPFGAWPSDMRREIGKNYREITFTFFYQ